jgi:hypothetical protein
MSDAVPPSAAVHYFDSSGLSKRSSAYGALLNALMPEQASTLATAPIAWFDSFEFERAFHGKGDAGIWNPVANLGDWNSFFSQPSGSLSRRVSQLILVSDYELTVTSHASYSSEDYQQITTQASFGIWPFFSVQASATNTSDYKHNENGTLSVTHRLGKGLIQIWGVNVQDAPN